MLSCVQAGDLFHTENSTSESNKCNLKVRGRMQHGAWPGAIACGGRGSPLQSAASRGMLPHLRILWRYATAPTCQKIAHQSSASLMVALPAHSDTKTITALSLSALQIAQFSAELERYPRAVELYEEVAKSSVDNNLLKYRCSVLLKSWTCIRSTES